MREIFPKMGIWFQFVHKLRDFIYQDPLYELFQKNVGPTDLGGFQISLLQQILIP